MPINDWRNCPLRSFSLSKKYLGLFRLFVCNLYDKHVKCVVSQKREHLKTSKKNDNSISVEASHLVCGLPLLLLPFSWCTYIYLLLYTCILSSSILSSCPTHFTRLFNNLPLGTSLCADRHNHIIILYHIIYLYCRDFLLVSFRSRFQAYLPVAQQCTVTRLSAAVDHNSFGCRHPLRLVELCTRF